jgi:hypothetical protein
MNQQVTKRNQEKQLVPSQLKKSVKSMKKKKIEIPTSETDLLREACHVEILISLRRGIIVLYRSQICHPFGQRKEYRNWETSNHSGVRFCSPRVFIFAEVKKESKSRPSDSDNDHN